MQQQAAFSGGRSTIKIFDETSECGAAEPRQESEDKFLMNFGNDSQLFQEEQDVHNFLSELKIKNI